MKRSEIIQIAREEYLNDVHDAEGADDSLFRWPTRQLIRLCGEAEREACRSGACELIPDQTTAALCRITLVTATQDYALDRRVLKVPRVLLDGTPIEHVTEDDLDERRPGWRGWMPGLPLAFFIRAGRLHLDRVPSAAEHGKVLALSVYREPLRDPKEHEEPEIPPAQHADLVHWIVHKALLKRGPDTYDPQGSAQALGLFRAAFGRERGADQLRALLENPPYLSLHLGRAYADHYRRWGGTGRERD